MRAIMPSVRWIAGLYACALARRATVGLLAAITLLLVGAIAPDAGAQYLETYSTNPATVIADGQEHTLYFKVYNNENQTGIEVSFSCYTTGALYDCVAPYPFELPAGPGYEWYGTVIPVRFKSSGPGGGQVVLSASTIWGGGQAYFDVTVVNPLTITAALPNNDNQKLALCANNCFAPVYTHSTVPYFSLGAARNVTLAYHGERTAVRPTVAVDVTVGSGAPQPQELTLQARINGAAVPFTNGDQVLHFRSDATVLPPGADTPTRLTAQLNATAYATGMYPLQLVVTAVFAGRQEVTTINTKLMVVNLRTPDLLPVQGWTVAGVQRLRVQPDGTVLIIEGDGSGVYFGCTSYTSRCSGPAGDFTTLQASGSGSLLTYTRAYPDSTKILFDNLGQMKRVTDRWGNYTSFEYSSGKLSKIYDPVLTYNGGATRTAIEFWYGAGSFTIAMPGPKGTAATAARGTVVTYDASGRVTAFRDPDAVSTNLGYDASGRLSSVTDRRGGGTTYTYDPVSWKLTRIDLPQIPVDVGGGATQMQTPTLRFRAAQTLGVPTAPTSVTALAAPVRADTAWALVVGADNDTTRFTVDCWGQPLVIKDALRNVTTIARDDRGRDTTVTNPLGQRDRYVYTGPFLTLRAPHEQPVIVFGYDAWGMVNSVRVESGPTRTATFDANSRTITERIDGLYPAVHYLDARGRDTLYTDPLGHPTRYRYDAVFGNLERTTAAEGQWSGVTYDAWGRDSLTSASGQPKAAMRTYDLLNRVTATYDTVGATPMRYTYDALYLTRVSDPKGQVYRAEVNALGWSTKVYDPADTLGRYQSTGYSPGGRVMSVRNRRGKLTEFRYDVLGRLTLRRDPLAPHDTFQYSPNGRVAVARNGISVDSIFIGDWGADTVVTWLGGRRFRRVHTGSPGAYADSTLITTSAPGLTFLPRTRLWRGDRSVLDTVWIGTNRVFFEYDGEMQHAYSWYPGYMRWDSTTTTHQRYASHYYYSPSLDPVLSRSYGLDSLGRIVSESRPDGVDASGRQVYNVATYAYSGAGPLKVYQRGPDAPTASLCFPGFGCRYWNLSTSDRNLWYEHDPARNVLEEHDVNGGMTVSGTFYPGNRVQSWAGVTYDYDADGNRTVRHQGGVDTYYDWSAGGRLLAVRSRSDTIQYDYNALGELVRRRRNGNVDRHFLWDQGQLLAEFDGAISQKLNEFAYRPGVDRPFARITGNTGGTVEFFETDQRGNVIGLVNGSSVTQHLLFGPWGELEVQSGRSLDSTRLGWKGLMWEGGATGLYYVRARWYDPATRSFISEDPVGIDGGVNTYAFAGNDPINGRDPTGLWGIAYSDDDDCTAAMTKQFDDAGYPLDHDVQMTIRLYCAGRAMVTFARRQADEMSFLARRSWDLLTSRSAAAVQELKHDAQLGSALAYMAIFYHAETNWQWWKNTKSDVGDFVKRCSSQIADAGWTAFSAGVTIGLGRGADNFRTGQPLGKGMLPSAVTGAVVGGAGDLVRRTATGPGC